ncbi:MAG: hypothetical protein AAF485_12790 [Chloroflexota bacterium]
MQKQSRWKFVVWGMLLIFGGSIACGIDLGNIIGDENAASTEEPTVETTATEAVADSSESPTAVPTEVVEATTEAENEEAVDSSSRTGEVREPTTVKAAAELVDFRTLPMMDGAILYQDPEVGYMFYEVSASLEDVVEFQTAQLTDMGWTEDENVRNVDAEWGFLEFDNQDFRLSLSLSETDGLTAIQMFNHSNVDARLLPQFSGAEAVDLSSPSNFLYFATSDIDAVVDFTESELANLGWQAYEFPFSSSTDDPDFKVMEFKQNGVGLTAFITTSAFEDDEVSVQYSVLLLPLDLPVLADPVNLEMDADAMYPYLSYQTSETMEDTLRFYEQEMATLDWASTDDGQTSADYTARIFGNDAEQVSLLLELTPAGDGLTLVTFNPAETGTMADTGDTTGDVLEDVSAFESDNVAVDLPVANDAESVVYDTDFEQITYNSPSDVETLVTLYRDSLTAMGWQEDNDFSTADTEFALLYFEQGDASIYVEISNFGLGDNTDVVIDTYNVAWNGVDGSDTTASASSSSGTGYTIDDWPIPTEAEAINRVGNELSFSVPWDAPTTAEFLRPTFVTMGLDTDFCLDDAGEYTSISCSTGAESIYLNFAMHSFDNETNVEITLENFDLADDSTLEPLGNLAASLSGLVLIEENGFFIPSNYTSFSTEGSQFSKTALVSTPSDFEALSTLYENELPNYGGTYLGHNILTSEATFYIEGPNGELSMTLSNNGSETEIMIIQKDAKAAADAGILPASGKGRIYLANPGETDLTVTVAGQTITVPPSDMTTDSPADSNLEYLDLAPDSYTIAVSDGAASESLDLAADTSWVVIVDTIALIPLQLY